LPGTKEEERRILGSTPEKKKGGSRKVGKDQGKEKKKSRKKFLLFREGRLEERQPDVVSQLKKGNLVGGQKRGCKQRRRGKDRRVNDERGR